MQPTLVTADMHYWRIAPDPRLRERVTCYWMVEAAPHRAPRPRLQHDEDLLLPDGHSEIVFNRGSTGFERWQLGKREQGQRIRGSYLIGGRAHSIATHAEEPVRLAGVKLESRFLRELLGVPLDEFRDSTLSLRDLGNTALLELDEKIAEAACATEVATLLDAFLLDVPRRAREPSATDALLRSIHRERGTTPIMRWAREAGISPGRLERTFCVDNGMTPKQYARVIRFKCTYHSLFTAPRRSLAAGLDGFYDQSHLNKEFKHFTGMAPSARLAGRMSAPMIITDHLLETELADGQAPAALFRRAGQN